MNPNDILGNVLKIFGIFAVSICLQFSFAKMTHLTMVVSPTHCYFGQAAEIPPSSNDGGNY